jgi:hypothetical protein
MPADDPLYAEILRRNARLRAWAAFGLPVEGRWDNDDGAWQLALKCRSCGSLDYRVYIPIPGRAVAEALAIAERGAVEVKPCAHLAPLLTEDPEEVRGLTALELLAGAR